MSKLIFDLSELEDFRDKLESGLLQDAVIEAALILAGEWFARAVEKSPVMTGTLRDSWVIGDMVFEDDTIVIEIYNTAVGEKGEPYPLYVELGHRQEVGRYVPAIGKRLVASWAEGKFMLRISKDEVEKMAVQIVSNKLEEAWNLMG